MEKDFSAKTLDVLTEREKEIYLFMQGQGGARPTLQDASSKFEITRERVRQIFEGAMKKLEGVQTRFDLVLGSSDGMPFSLSVAPREHILVSGELCTGKTILFQRMIAELRARYADSVDLIVFDPKGCEYSNDGVTLFRHQKSVTDLSKLINHFLVSKDSTKKTTFFFIDEIDNLVHFRGLSQALKTLFATAKNVVVVLSTQVAELLEPFVGQASIFIQFCARRALRGRCLSVLSNDFDRIQPSDEIGDFVIKSKNMGPLLVHCVEYKRR